MILGRLFVLIFAAGALFATSSGFAAVLLGPYPASVERVVDGDTIAVKIAVWLDQDIHVLVRLRGIDAPELHGRCPEEKALALAAKSALERIVAGGPIMLKRIEGDKFNGRVVADVASAQGQDIGSALIASGLVRPYDGGLRGSWCGTG